MNRRLELEIIIQIPRTIEIYSKILFPTILCKIVHTLNLKKEFIWYFRENVRKVGSHFKGIRSEKCLKEKKVSII